MSSKEYMGWFKYFEQQPYGLREDYRAAILMQVGYQGKDKLDVTKYFPSLNSISKSDEVRNKKAKDFYDNVMLRTKHKK